jgi:hypothetical protein
MPPPEQSLDAKYHLTAGLPSDWDPPENWNPKETVLAVLTYEVVDQRLLFKFKSKGYYATANIGAFVENLQGGRSLGEMKAPPTPLPSEHPLEIWVRDQCYVVVALDPDCEMRFRAGGPGITSKEQYRKKNCGLVQIDKDGAVLPSDLPGPDCQIAYFAVVYRDKAERHHFTFHLDLLQDGDRGWLEVGIDPDVPDDGGGIPFVDKQRSPT